MQALNRSFVRARSCLALELPGVAEIPVGLAWGFNDALRLRATRLEILIRPLVLVGMELCSTFFPQRWLCWLFRLSARRGGKSRRIFPTKAFPAPPPLKPTLGAAQLGELVLIPPPEPRFQAVS